MLRAGQSSPTATAELSRFLAVTGNPEMTPFVHVAGLPEVGSEPSEKYAYR